MNTPIQDRILRLIESGPVTFVDVLQAFEPMGIKKTDTGKAVIDLLTTKQIFIFGEGQLLTRKL